MNSNYKQYLSQKTKYISLKSQHGGHLPDVLERGVGFNIKKFMSIIDNKGMFSANDAAKSGISALESHAAATGGNDSVSFSAKHSHASKIYSVHGITFIVDTRDLVDGGSKRGALSGEVYINGHIPLANIMYIYVDNVSKDILLHDLPICSLSYGSTSIEDKLRYQFEKCGEDATCRQNIKSHITTLIYEYNTAIKKMGVEYYELAKKNSRDAKYLNDVKETVTNKYIRPVEKKCANMYVTLLSHQLDNDNIKKMTLGMFVRYYLKLRNIEIPVIHTLDYQ
jgi:hypothetical protein